MAYDVRVIHYLYLKPIKLRVMMCNASHETVVSILANELDEERYCTEDIRTGLTTYTTRTIKEL